MLSAIAMSFFSCVHLALLCQQPSGMDQVWPSSFGDAWMHGGQGKDSTHSGIGQNHHF